jgi:hypothetical protein
LLDLPWCVAAQLKLPSAPKDNSMVALLGKFAVQVPTKGSGAAADGVSAAGVNWGIPDELAVLSAVADPAVEIDASICSADCSAFEVAWGLVGCWEGCTCCRGAVKTRCGVDPNWLCIVADCECP